jgi:ADP-ribosyl-[dinitrogen reductase] hydrolase
MLVHCKGGLGRAGTIAAQLMIELGAPPKDAVTAVRSTRLGAIETSAQLAYMMILRVAL